MTTEDGIVPTAPAGLGPQASGAAPEGPPLAGTWATEEWERQRRSQRRWTFAAIAVFVLGGTLLFLSTYSTDYVLLKPGSARPTSPVLVFEGVETYEPETQINFTTVALASSVSPLEAIAGWLDPDIDVFTREEIFGPDVSPEENRQVNVQLMDSSQQLATRVALTQLGYDIPIDGVQVASVVEGSGADGVIDPGDQLEALDGEPLDEPTELTDLLAAYAPGDTVTLTVLDAETGELDDRAVVLAEFPEEPGRPFIGISGVVTYDLPFSVTIDAGNVGGPSAGLAFTLGILDWLTPEDLTGGVEVAVTGSIDAAGNVGAIGGIRQKVTAVREQGIPVFLVPAANHDDALSKAGDGLQIIPVSTLSDAISALRSLGGGSLSTVDEIASS